MTTTDHFIRFRNNRAFVDGCTLHENPISIDSVGKSLNQLVISALYARLLQLSLHLPHAATIRLKALFRRLK